MSVWANCPLKISDLELQSWLLHDVLSVKYPGCAVKRGGLVQLRLLCLSACLQPVSWQLGVGCGFIHLNTAAAFKSGAGDRGSDPIVPNPSCVPVLDVVRKPLHFLLLPTPCWFVAALFHSPFLRPLLVWDERVSLVIQLSPNTCKNTGCLLVLWCFMCSLRKHLHFLFELYLAVQETKAFGKPKLAGASPLLCSYF